METDEADDLIWEVFGGLDPWIIGLAGALKGRKKEFPHSPFQIPPFILVIFALIYFLSTSLYHKH